MYYPQYSARIRFIPLHNYDVKKIDDCIVALGDALLKNGFDYDFLPIKTRKTPLTARCCCPKRNTCR